MYIFFAIFLCIISISLWLTIKMETDWKVIYQATGRTEKAHSRCAYLKSRGIRCRVSPLNTGYKNTPGTMDTLRVLVHKKDLHKAHQVLANYKGI